VKLEAVRAEDDMTQDADIPEGEGSVPLMSTVGARKSRTYGLVS